MNERKVFFMEQLSKFMLTVDKVLNSLFIAFLVVSIVMVGFGVLGFFIDSSYIGEVDEFVTLGAVKLELSAGAVMKGENETAFLIFSAFALAVKFALLCVLMKLIRVIITPMKEGKPFADTVCKGLKTLSVFVLAGGIVNEIVDIIGTVVTYKLYDIQSFFAPKTVTSVSLDITSNGDFVIFAVVLYFLSFIFKYGEQLQNQADETL